MNRLHKTLGIVENGKLKVENDPFKMENRKFEVNTSMINSLRWSTFLRALRY